MCVMLASYLSTNLNEYHLVFVTGMEKKDFSFPYTPYEIQLNLMQEIYNCIEENKVGLLFLLLKKG